MQNVFYENVFEQLGTDPVTTSINSTYTAWKNTKEDATEKRGIKWCRKKNP